MTSRTAKRVAAAGLVSSAVMWGFMFFALVALHEALGYADAAVKGDLPNVTKALRHALDLAQIGSTFGLAGYILLFVGVLKGEARAGWIYRGGLAVSVAYLPFIPVGTILGVCGIVHFRRHKQEYFKPVLN